MFSKKQAKYEVRAKIIKALAHPTRLFLVDELAKKEQCVCKLTEMVGADMSTVSKHLSVLKNVGLVQDEKRGTQVFYRLNCPCTLTFFECMENIIKASTREQIKLLS